MVISGVGGGGRGSRGAPVIVECTVAVDKSALLAQERAPNEGHPCIAKGTLIFDVTGYTIDPSVYTPASVSLFSDMKQQIASRTGGKPGA